MEATISYLTISSIYVPYILKKYLQKLIRTSAQRKSKAITMPVRRGTFWVSAQQLTGSFAPFRSMLGV